MKKYLFFALVLFLGFFVRVVFTTYGLTGDITAFAEWGQRFWELGSKYFYFSDGWYYTKPVYPPLSNLLFAAIYWLFEHRYVLAQLHNVVRFPPASFLVFFGEAYSGSPFLYGKGYFLLLKLPTILADLVISLIIYKIVLEVTKNTKKAWLGMLIYIFNPVSIFVSGVWGQTESLIGIFGLLAFVLLYYKKAYLSIPLFFISLYLKPTWIILAPWYVFVLYFVKPKIKHLLIGLVSSLIIYLFATAPFSSGNVISFTYDLIFKTIIPKGGAKASISAFNFYTIFMKIDIDFADKILLFIKAKTLGVILYVLVNISAIYYLIHEKKNKLLAIVSGIFTIGLGSWLFTTNMLERYFYAAFPVIVIILAVNSKKFLPLIVINIILFANLVWAFYRRGSDELDHPFTDNNFFLIRVLSVTIVFCYLFILNRLINMRNKALS